MGTLVITHEAGKNIRLNVNGGDWTPRSSTETSETYLVLEGGVFNVFEGNRIVMRFFNEEQVGFYVEEINPPTMTSSSLEFELIGQNLNIYGTSQPVVYVSNDNSNPMKNRISWASRFTEYECTPTRIYGKLSSSPLGGTIYLGALEINGEIIWVNNTRPL